MIRKAFAILLAIALLFEACPASFAATLTLPENLEVIEAEAFEGDTSLDDVELQENVRAIEARAFADSSLKRINLPPSVEYIAPDAFENAPDAIFDAAEDTYAFQWLVDNHYLIFVVAEAPWTDCYNVWWVPVMGVENYRVLTYSDEACETLYRMDEAGEEGVFVYTDVGTQYWFVMEYEQDGQTYRSDPVTVEPLEAMPAPENLTSALTEDGCVTLTWDAVDGATGYRVYYSTTTDEWYPEMAQIPFEGAPEDWSESWLQVDRGETMYLWVCADNGEGSNYRAHTVAQSETITEDEFFALYDDDRGLYLSADFLDNLSFDNIQDEAELAQISEQLQILRQAIADYNAALNSIMEYIYNSPIYVDIGTSRIYSADISYSISEEVMELLSQDYEFGGIVSADERQAVFAVTVDGTVYYLVQNGNGMSIASDYQPRSAALARNGGIDTVWNSMEDSHIEISHLFDLTSDALELMENAADWLKTSGIELSDFADNLSMIKKIKDIFDVRKKINAYLEADRILRELAVIRSHMHPTPQEEMYDWTRESAEIMNSEIDAAIWGLRSEIANNWFSVYQALTAFMSKGAPSAFEEKYKSKIDKLQNWINGKTKYGQYAKNVFRFGEFALSKCCDAMYKKAHELYNHVKQLDAQLHYDIIGVVKDQDNRSLPNVLVSVLIDSSRVSFVTDSNGYYTLEAPSASTYLSFEKDGYVTSGPVQVACEPYVPSRKDITLEKSLWGTIRGTVKDEYGDLLPGVAVMCGEYNESTNNNGEYSISLPVGERKLVFSKDGYATATKQILVAETNQPQDETLRWKRGLIGTVTDQNGPVAGARVVLRYPGESYGTRYDTTSDENGRFRLMVPARDYDVFISANNHIDGGFLSTNSEKYANVTEDKVVEFAVQMYDTTGKYKKPVTAEVIHGNNDPQITYTKATFSWEGHTAINKRNGGVEPIGFTCVSDNAIVSVTIKLEYEVNGVSFEKTATKTVDLTQYTTTAIRVNLGRWNE